MNPRIARFLSNFFLVLGIALLALAGWLWWIDRPPVTALAFDSPVQLGAITVDENHIAEIPVTNTSRQKIRLVGLADEAC
jgi:hypothetical protein